MMTGSGKFRSLKRKGFDYANVLSDLDSKKPYRKKVKSCAKFWDQEVDRDYDWLLNFLLNTDKQKKVKIFENHDENINHYENEDDYENEHEEEEEDANDEDPQYCLFLQNLVQNGRSYKLKISKDDEPLRFLHYEESENSVGYDDIDDDDDPPTYGEYANQIPQDMQIVQRDEQMLIGKEGKISTINEVSRKKKTNEPNSVIGPYLGTWDSCYLRFLKEFNPSNGKFFYEGKEVEYEKSDKQLVLAENQQVLSEKQQVLAEKQLVLPGKQPVLAEKRLSLKEKLMRILRKPYSKREYKDLKEYAEEQKPICRLLPLRDRSISSALEGMSKSVLDDSPGCFRRRFESAKQERSKAKALNLLRMLRFWLEHVPNEDIFEPWLDKDILAVLPLPRTT